MKAKVSLKNYIYIVFAIMFFVAGFILANGKVYAVGTGEWLGVPDADQSLNPQEQLVEIGILGTYIKEGEDAAFQSLKRQTEAYKTAGKPLDQQMVQDLINQGYFPNYIEEIKALGYTDVDYSVISGGSSTSAQSENTEPASAPEPAAFTVEDMEDTPMWATQAVNYRDGASTDYNKIGSLEQYEQVIVNGVASTGWYRFITTDGGTAYVSNNYLTTEDPGSRELNINNEETGQVDTSTFEDAEPDAIDEGIENIKEEYEEKETAVEEPEPELEPEKVIAVEEEPEEEVTVEEESSVYSWQFYVACVFAVVCVIIIGICIYNVIRNKRRGRVD